MSQETSYVHKDGQADLARISNAAAKVTSPLTNGTTGITEGFNGEVRRGMFKITVGYAALQAAALTKDLVLGKLPAKSRLISIVADTTEAFAGPAGTLNLTVGKTAGGAEFIASHDVKSGAVTKGLADADMGTSMTRAAAVQGGTVSSWSADTDLQLRLTSNSGNLSSLSAGSVTIYAVVEMM